MASSKYYIPQQIKVKGHLLFFVKQCMFVGNTKHAKLEIKKMRKENPNKTFRLNYFTISEYK